MLHIKIHNHLLKEGYNQKLINRFLKQNMQSILRYNSKNWTLADWVEIFETWNDNAISKKYKQNLIDQKHREKVFQWLKQNEYFSNQSGVKKDEQHLTRLNFEIEGKGTGSIYIGADYDIWDWSYKTLDGREIDEFGEIEFEFAKIIIAYNEFLTDPHITFA